MFSIKPFNKKILRHIDKFSEKYVLMFSQVWIKLFSPLHKEHSYGGWKIVHISRVAWSSWLKFATSAYLYLLILSTLSVPRNVTPFCRRVSAEMLEIFARGRACSPMKVMQWVGSELLGNFCTAVALVVAREFWRVYVYISVTADEASLRVCGLQLFLVSWDVITAIHQLLLTMRVHSYMGSSCSKWVGIARQKVYLDSLIGWSRWAHVSFRCLSWLMISLRKQFGSLL
jgi:hypothetical protein